MPTIFTHPVPVTAVALGIGTQVIPLRLLAAGIICALLPDIDVISFQWGISYANILGHRGFSHSLAFAFIAGGVGALIAPWLHSGRRTAFWVMGGALLSHIVLDAMTNGGLGVAFFWPMSTTRYFLPWRPIQVSPFSLQALFSERGLSILRSEFFAVWVPCLFFMFGAWAGRAAGRKSG